MVKCRAVGDRVFIRLEVEDKISQGGIIMPDCVVNEQNSGVVESVGEKVTLVKKGDKVLFHIFDDLPAPDDDMVVVRENSILGVWE